jgi:hypothetical protein
MNAKDLIDLGIAEDVAKQVIVLHGKDIEAKKSEIAAEKANTDAVQKQLDEANKAIDGFKKLDPEGIKKAADDWKQKAETFQAEAEQAKKDAENSVLDYKFNSRLEAKLEKEFKARNPKHVVGQLDKSLLKYNAEKDDVEGNLADQIKPIQEKEPYLFDDGKTQPRIVTGTRTQTGNEPSLASAIAEGLGIKQ